MKTLRRFSVSILCATLCVLASCAQAQARPDLTDEESAVSVATVRALLDKEYTRDAKTQVFVLCFAEFTDPSPAFLAQFAPQILLPCSATRAKNAPPRAEVSGKPAKTAMLGVPKLTSPTQAEIGVIFWHNPGFVTGAVFHMELREGHWIVARRQGTFITLGPTSRAAFRWFQST